MNRKSIEAAVARNRAKTLKRRAATETNPSTKVMLLSVAEDLKRTASEARLAANAPDEPG